MALPTTTGNTGHQAPATGAGTDPPAPGTGGAPPAGASTLSTVAGALIKWPDLIAQSGAGPELDAYLQAQNINRTATLALMGADLWATAVSEAILRLWLEARCQWQAHNTAIDPATVAVATPGAISVAAASGAAAPQTSCPRTSHSGRTRSSQAPPRA